MYDDVGSLSVAPGKVRFVGSKADFEITGIETISLARQSWNWMTWLVVIGLTAPGYVFLWSASPAYALATAGLIAMSTILVRIAQKWVVITGRNQAGEPVRAWFAAGAARGWHGLIGGTHTLHDAIVVALGAESRAAQQARRADKPRPGELSSPRGRWAASVCSSRATRWADL